MKWAVITIFTIMIAFILFIVSIPITNNNIIAVINGVSYW